MIGKMKLNVNLPRFNRGSEGAKEKGLVEEGPKLKCYPYRGRPIIVGGGFVKGRLYAQMVIKRIREGQGR